MLLREALNASQPLQRVALDTSSSPVMAPIEETAVANEWDMASLRTDWS